MATVCSNTSSSSSSSISNSSEQKLAETSELEQYQDENFANQLYNDTLKETNQQSSTNTAQSTNHKEFNCFHDDLANTISPNTNVKNSFYGQVGSPSTTPSNVNDYQTLRIKVKSIENHLLPLVNQITHLVNFRDLTSKKLTPLSSPRNSQAYNSSSLNSERNASALMRVGEAVNIAVERFVNVGERIAYENPSIKLEMLDACRHAKNAGTQKFSFGWRS